ncbi:MAG: septum formation protein Maf [Candidatus Schekmanbacteria bacterium GWA2_38_9]|uniref:dTTP/UTP pyrophosphatase n=1 Tax=Candidatus Schekmanbacteria bacterium RIFCSPLOWO2_12_FULL_38_15 TaxID=1817883 RepID=A0A1F7SJE0_9BACT|nr:MAG: septum formation protein Maf [Candidatus Schekmanbacteria bacterium GWA2_38_9]OGL50433.1 MAG: septum formation protein Maf [Candidatus Schekmanbacteria bacterium RIFCSPLOWO2_02_FULL_38_14]OGL53892.1 MAG: septum formation protein Maf [Candidatus Schekmanbacteria bacterium RIFCSPLOWO2_12_FULL_38_15]
MNTHIILASSSPRKNSLLTETGLKFKTVPSNVDEKAKISESAEDFALRTAKEKALKASLKEKGIIIAADTVIKIDSSIIGKPKDGKDAVRILSRLSGRKHAVITGLAVYDTSTKRFYTKCVRTYVTMDTLSPEQIKSYVRTGEPLDKAGGYAIQGKGKFFIRKIDGCYFNVVGLPLNALSKLLNKAGCKKLF